LVALKPLDVRPERWHDAPLFGGHRVVKRAWFRIFIFFLVSLACVGSAVAAGRGDDEDALIKAGVESRKRLDDATALQQFSKAYAVRKSPRAAAQMGLAEMALGKWVDAEAHIQEALEASSDRWVSKNVSSLRQALSSVRDHLGSLELLGSPAGAEIVIDGEVRGHLPLGKPLRVRVGEWPVEVRAPGYQPASFKVQVVSGGLARESVNLPPVLTVAPPRVEEPRRTEVSEGPGHEQPPVLRQTGPSPGKETRAEASAGSGLRTTGVVLGAVGVAALGAGIYFGVAGHQAGVTNTGRPVYDASADAAGKRDHTLQFVGYVAGGALVAAGVTTFLLGGARGAGAEAGDTHVAVLPFEHGLTAAVQGTF
jgi:hypothetical protein